MVSTAEQRLLRERLRPQASYCYLLDADADLAQEFDIRMRVVARQVATVVVFEIPVGDCDPASGRRRARAASGLLLLDGVIAVRRPGRRPHRDRADGRRRPAATAPDPAADELLEHSATAGTSSLPARVAVLDAGFAERVRPWPQILLALLRRAGKRACDLDIQRAIASPAAAGGPPGADAVAPRRALGEASSPAASASRCP